MSSYTLHLTLCLSLFSSQLTAAAVTDVTSHNPAALQGPSTLSFDELVTLATNDPPPAPLQQKLDHLLRTPFVSNEAKALGVLPKVPHVAEFGPVLRLAEWNINRGENESEVELALTDANGFITAARKNASLKPSDLSLATEEVRELQGSDVVILDEVDDGVNRTKYQNVTRDLAQALQMNYVYGVEFIELNRIYLGAEKLDEIDRPNTHPGEIFGLDPARYLGLEGSAILSRYPIHSARLVRLPQEYDW